MLGRRLLVLMAVLLGLTALAASLAPRPRVAGPGAGTPRNASPSPAPAPSADAGGASRRVVMTVKADRGARPATVRARPGDIVELTVEGDVLDSVELDGLNEIEPLEPGSPARFEILADTEGRFPIRLLDADRRIGRIDVKAQAR